MIGMGIAIAAVLINITSTTDPLTIGLIVVGIGIGGLAGATFAFKVPMTSMPETVAILNSFGGLGAVLVSVAAFLAPADFGLGVSGSIHAASLFGTSLGIIIGAVTFSGSIVAFTKLQGLVSGAPVGFPLQHPLNALLTVVLVALIVTFCRSESLNVLMALTILALVVGVLIIIPIGGADMPVVISMLNSYSGWAGALVGFTLGNTALIVTGAIVGSSGAILSYIMCKAMNRSFFNVILGGFGGEVEATALATGAGNQSVKQGSAEDAAFILKNAETVIIVPGYGLAVAQAQHALDEMSERLKAEGVKVKYAIHPVAGRMPGHMNVLLAEAGVSYDEVFELDDINSDFSSADVAFVIGANDVTNPAAKNNPASPIYGMPVLDVENAKTVLFIKRSMASGYAGIENELFFRDNTLMLFSDAKKMVEGIIKAF